MFPATEDREVEKGGSRFGQCNDYFILPIHPLQTPENYLNSFGLKCTPKTPSLLASDWLSKKLQDPSICRRMGFCQFLGCKKSAKTKHFQKDRGLCQFLGCKKSAQLRLFENVWVSSVGFSPFFVPQGQLFWREKEETQLKNLHKPLLSLKR